MEFEQINLFNVPLVDNTPSELNTRDKIEALDVGEALEIGRYSIERTPRFYVVGKGVEFEEICYTVDDVEARMKQRKKRS